MKTQTLPQAIHVVGIELRTTNLEAFDTIPRHWQRFGQEAVLAQIDSRTGDDVYAVYTHFEHAGRSNAGLYSLVIGAAVDAGAAVPVGMVRVVVPASQRAVFGVEQGRPDLVGEAWQRIWQGAWRHRDLCQTHVADFERYAADGAIEISVGIAPEAATLAA